MAKVKDSLGVLFRGDNFTLVKKSGAKGDLIDKHNHPEANIIFTVVKGKVSVYINENENYILEPGKVLNFDGDNYISAEYLEDSELFVTLILK